MHRYVLCGVDLIPSVLALAHLSTVSPSPQGLICSETSETMSRCTGYDLGFGETALVAWEPLRRAPTRLKMGVLGWKMGENGYFSLIVSRRKSRP